MTRHRPWRHRDIQLNFPTSRSRDSPDGEAGNFGAIRARDWPTVLFVVLLLARFYGPEPADWATADFISLSLSLSLSLSISLCLRSNCTRACACAFVRSSQPTCDEKLSGATCGCCESDVDPLELQRSTMRSRRPDTQSSRWPLTVHPFRR